MTLHTFDLSLHEVIQLISKKVLQGNAAAYSRLDTRFTLFDSFPLNAVVKEIIKTDGYDTTK